MGSKYSLSNFDADKTRLSCNLHFSRENNENQGVVPKIKISKGKVRFKAF